MGEIPRTKTEKDRWVKLRLGTYPVIVKTITPHGRVIRPDQLYALWERKFARLPYEDHAVWMFKTEEDAQYFREVVGEGVILNDA